MKTKAKIKTYYVNKLNTKSENKFRVRARTSDNKLVHIGNFPNFILAHRVGKEFLATKKMPKKVADEPVLGTFGLHLADPANSGIGSLFFAPMLLGKIGLMTMEQWLKLVAELSTVSIENFKK
jgi:hypothetical protein